MSGENGTGSFIENSTGKRREIFKKYSSKCQRICTVDREIEAISVNKSPKIRKI